METLEPLQAKVLNNQYNWDLLNSSRMSGVVVDSESMTEMVIEFETEKQKSRLLPEFQTEDNS